MLWCHPNAGQCCHWCVQGSDIVKANCVIPWIRGLYNYLRVCPNSPNVPHNGVSIGLHWSTTENSGQLDKSLKKSIDKCLSRTQQTEDAVPNRRDGRGSQTPHSVFLYFIWWFNESQWTIRVLTKMCPQDPKSCMFFSLHSTTQLIQIIQAWWCVGYLNQLCSAMGGQDRVWETLVDQTCWPDPVALALVSMGDTPS
jgi:hypothetical protein